MSALTSATAETCGGCERGNGRRSSPENPSCPCRTSLTFHGRAGVGKTREAATVIVEPSWLRLLTYAANWRSNSGHHTGSPPDRGRGAGRRGPPPPPEPESPSSSSWLCLASRASKPMASPPKAMSIRSAIATAGSPFPRVPASAAPPEVATASMKECTIGLPTFLVVSAASRWAFPSRGRDKPNASVARYGACDLSQLSVPSGQLRALALRTASAMSHVPAALAGGHGELGPNARSRISVSVYVPSPLRSADVVVCWAEYLPQWNPRPYPRAGIGGEESPRLPVGDARPRASGSGYPELVLR